MKNLKENSDIVNYFFKKKFQLLVEHVFPILKITDFIARSEFQGRGSIHIHAILAVDGNVTPKDMELAMKSTQSSDELCEIQVNVASADNIENILEENLENNEGLTEDLNIDISCNTQINQSSINETSTDNIRNASDKNIANNEKLNENGEINTSNIQINQSSNNNSYKTDNIGDDNLETNEGSNENIEFDNSFNLEINQLSNINDKTTMDEDPIISGQKKICNFAVNHIGLTAVHPNPNPMDWPERMPHIKDNECLRINIKDIHDPKKMTEIYESRVNLVQRHACFQGYCLKCSKKNKETNDCKYRFKFPKDIHGFITKTDDQKMICEVCRMKMEEEKYKDKDIKYKYKEEKRVAPDGASIVKGKICPIRNHPRIVEHIKEMPIIWGANTEAQVVTSWRKLLMYIVKYVMKAEKPSDAFNKIAKELLHKEGEDTPVRKIFSRLLINSVGTDKSRAECFLIALDGNYVQYSKPYEWINLNGNKRFKLNVSSEDDIVLETKDRLYLYAERDTNEHYIELCTNFENGKFEWSFHPKYISLRGFATYFTIHWLPKEIITVPIFSPIQKFNVKKKHKSYENSCRCILLSEKPGCYITNVGNDFQTFEEELRDFVSHSKFCPPLIKQEFEESQIECEDQLHAEDLSDEEDQLLVSPLQNPEEEEEDIPTEFQLQQPHENIMQKHTARDDDVASDYDSEEFINEALKYDWDTDLNTLEQDIPNSIDLVTNWLQDIKKSHVSMEDETDDVDFKLCNKDQTVFYQYICDWIERKLVNPDEDPIYLILSGRAGCGKTFAVKCVKKYINEKCKAGFLKMAAPTGTAAFLIKGETLHSLFKLPVNKPFSEELTELKGDTLTKFQNTFKDTELLIIDEMSMVGQYMLYQINRRLQQAKPHKSTTNFAGVSIVLMGDFAQLPPVTDKALFQARGGSQFQSIGRCLYKDNFKKNFTLRESMRQRGNDQTVFRNILDGIANGEFLDDDWENFV